MTVCLGHVYKGLALVALAALSGCGGRDVSSGISSELGTPVPPAPTPVPTVSNRAGAPAPPKPSTAAKSDPAPPAAGLTPLLAAADFGKGKTGPDGWWVSAPDRVMLASETGPDGSSAWILLPDATTDTRLVRTIYANVAGERLEAHAKVKNSEAGSIALAILGKSNGKEIFVSTRNKGGSDWEDLRVAADLPTTIDKNSLTVRVVLAPGTRQPALVSGVSVSHGKVSALMIRTAASPAILTEGTGKPAPATAKPTQDSAKAAAAQHYRDQLVVFLTKQQFNTDQGGKPAEWWVSNAKLVRRGESKAPDGSPAWTITPDKKNEVRLVRSIYADLSGRRIALSTYVKSEEKGAVTVAVLCKAGGADFYRSVASDAGDWKELRLTAQLPDKVETDSLSVRLVVKPGLKKPVEIAGTEIYCVERVAGPPLSLILKREDFALAENGLPRGWWASAKDRIESVGTNSPCGKQAWQLAPHAEEPTRLVRTIYADLGGKFVELAAQVKSAEAGAVVLSLSGKSKGEGVFASARNAGTGEWEMLRISRKMPDTVDPGSLSVRITLASGAKSPAEIGCVELGGG